MEANCRVWSSKLNEVLAVKCHIGSGGDAWMYNSIIGSWRRLNENDINELGLSFYPGV